MIDLSKIATGALLTVELTNGHVITAQRRYNGAFALTFDMMPAARASWYLEKTEHRRDAEHVIMVADDRGRRSLELRAGDRLWIKPEGYNAYETAPVARVLKNGSPALGVSVDQAKMTMALCLGVLVVAIVTAGSGLGLLISGSWLIGGSLALPAATATATAATKVWRCRWVWAS